ncbi:MAG: thermonuclease family protein, partial [Deltaproteobacteria bacterium]|nr:thermonuclease family protein [Deltaproteobacteria bacterium]
MIKRPVRLASPFIFFAFVLFFYGCGEAPGRQTSSAAGGSARELYVDEVIDGDTVSVTGGERVRYIGVDTPEAGEPFYKEAKKRNGLLVRGRKIRLAVCEKEPKDRYGRTLAWVWADGELVSAVLLREGMGRILIIPPCGIEKAGELKAASTEAMSARRGIWGVTGGYSGYKTILAEEAIGHAGEAVMVRGRVARVHKSRNAVFIDFGSGRRSFTAVIFREGLEKFESAGIDPIGYNGKTIAVAGVVKEYKGRPEIIVKGPSQIERM